MKRGHKPLTTEDRILWSRVARTAVPLDGKRFPEDERPASISINMQDQAMPAPTKPNAAPRAASPSQRQPRRLDMPTREKLSRGRLDIGGRVDLHGLTQDEAYMLLLSFLRSAYEADRRYLLVITGKGSSSGGQGVLRRAVPQWLSTPPFRAIVGGYEEAAKHHGGAGALYLRLRRGGSGR